MKSIILASQSPRRQQLLKMCGMPFETDAADIDETIDTGNDLADEIQHLAERKADAVLLRHPDCVIIGADTIVAVEGKVLGKPKDETDAERMLKMLSGNTHQVITGLAVISSIHRYSASSISNVTFARMSEEEIRQYVSSREPMDKAGAYAIQGQGGLFITGIEGDYYSIMGLPVSMVYQQLKHLSEY